MKRKHLASVSFSLVFEINHLAICFVWKMRILNIKIHTPNRISERVHARGCDRAQGL